MVTSYEAGNNRVRLRWFEQNVQRDPDRLNRRLRRQVDRGNTGDAHGAADNRLGGIITVFSARSRTAIEAKFVKRVEFDRGD